MFDDASRKLNDRGINAFDYSMDSRKGYRQSCEIKGISGPHSINEEKSSYKGIYVYMTVSPKVFSVATQYLVPVWKIVTVSAELGFIRETKSNRAENRRRIK